MSTGAEGNTTQKAYDADGNVTWDGDARGETATYLYDNNNRLWVTIDRDHIKRLPNNPSKQENTNRYVPTSMRIWRHTTAAAMLVQASIDVPDRS
jgi:YD repeat-containing protein